MVLFFRNQTRIHGVGYEGAFFVHPAVPAVIANQDSLFAQFEDPVIGRTGNDPSAAVNITPLHPDGGHCFIIIIPGIPYRETNAPAKGMMVMMMVVIPVSPAPADADGYREAAHDGRFPYLTGADFGQPSFKG